MKSIGKTVLKQIKINQPGHTEIIDFQKNLTILYGPVGSGKSSVLKIITNILQGGWHKFNHLNNLLANITAIDLVLEDQEINLDLKNNKYKKCDPLIKRVTYIPDYRLYIQYIDIPKVFGSFEPEPTEERFVNDIGAGRANRVIVTEVLGSSYLENEIVLLDDIEQSLDHGLVAKIINNLPDYKNKQIIATTNSAKLIETNPDISREIKLLSQYI